MASSAGLLTGAAPPFGFTTAATSWLPRPAEWGALTAAAQDGDPDSTLLLYRRALALRRATTDLHESSFGWVDAAQDCLAYRRGAVLVVLNAGDSNVPLPAGEVMISSGPLAADALPGNTAVWLRA